MNALQLCRGQFSHKVADFLQAKCDFRWKTTFLRFWAPVGGFIDNVRCSS